MIGEEPTREIYNPTKYFVEFGHGGNPAPIIYNQDFNSKYYYIGVDTNSELSTDHYSEKDLVKALQRPNVAFIEGNKPFYEHNSQEGTIAYPKSAGKIIGSIPKDAPIVNQLGMIRFKDNSINTAFIANTLGSPRVQKSQNLHLLWDDILRSVEIGGNLIILETRTPYKLETLEGIASGYELKVQKVSVQGDIDFEKEIEPYNSGGGVYTNTGESYIIYFKKTENTNSHYDFEAHFS